jgi:hypothetical protein
MYEVRNYKYFGTIVRTKITSIKKLQADCLLQLVLKLLSFRLLFKKPKGHILKTLVSYGRDTLLITQRKQHCNHRELNCRLIRGCEKCHCSNLKFHLTMIYHFSLLYVSITRYPHVAFHFVINYLKNLLTFNRYSHIQHFKNLYCMTSCW